MEYCSPHSNKLLPQQGTKALEVPNVFTPYSDGVNDVFSLKVVGVSNMKFAMYNRWGISLTPALSKGEGANSVASRTTSIGSGTTSDTDVNWNERTTSGIECSAGVYFYVL